MELPHDLVERVLEKLPVKSLLRLKTLSRYWKSTIESRCFKERQMIVHQQSRSPDILLINPIDRYTYREVDKSEENVYRMLTLNPWDVVKIPNLCPPQEAIVLKNRGNWYCLDSVCGSCDGLICFYNHYNFIHVVNPTIRWSRSVPHARFQTNVLDLMCRRNWSGENPNPNPILFWDLGFGKDKFTNTYKLVWLYNVFELGLVITTTCEVFDFSTNTWRYVTAAPPCRILDKNTPLYLDGSLHWFTDEYIVETRILSFDLHTEKFRIISKAPFVQATCKQIIMCNLNNRLCVSQQKWPRQDIWGLGNSDKTWKKLYSLNLPTDSDWFTNDQLGRSTCVIPVMIMKNSKTLVLFDACAEDPSLVLYDPELKSYNLCFALNSTSRFWHGKALSYIQSLISIV